MNSQAPENESDQVLISMDAPLASVIREVERLYLERVLTLAGGNKKKAAELAGMSHETFRKKVARYTVQTIFSLA